MLMKVSLGTMVVEVGQRGSKSKFLEGFFCFFPGHILTYIPLESQFNAEPSFLGNHGLKMFSFQDIGGQSKR